MQLFTRCGSFGTVVLEANSRDTFSVVKQQLCERHPELGQPPELAVYYRGRVCRDGCSLRRARVAEGATLDVQGRLRGGGGDGGSTGAESRDCYLEMYAGRKNDKVNPAEEKLAKWTTCQLTGEPLSPPCCADEVGNLFNKEALVSALVSRTLPKAFGHISGLKSLLNLKLTPNSNRTNHGTTNGSARNGLSNGNGNGNGGAKSLAEFQPGNEADWVCPVSGRDMNGRFRFVALRPSGLVVAEKALKEAPDAVTELAGGEWSPADVLVLNPEGDELLAAREAALLKLAAAKAKKGKKKGVENGRDGGAKDAAAPLAKKARYLPGPNSMVYRSLFRDPSKEQKETYCCRSTSARGMNMT